MNKKNIYKAPNNTKHLLKILPEYFEEVLKGNKTFEIRKNDRGFKLGDILILAEYSISIQSFTGRVIEKEVTYILEGGSFGIEKSFVVMSLQALPISIFDKERSKLIDFAYDMNLQNLNPRLTENESFKEGIEVGVDEILEYLETIKYKGIKKG